MAKIHTNNLIDEKSPYLLQHAHNPVNWYPWCKAAFAKAKEENKPVFLSIGYSTCHWCHVMEHESFEDEETAKILNKHYIAIKVDREERPDIDAVYMEVCMAMNKSGGWPMTVLLTPEQKPFFAATYLPKTSRYGLVGLDDLLTKIAETWEQDRDKLLASADSISALMKDLNRKADRSDEPTEELIELGREQLLRTFDTENGGFGGTPKFPAPHNMIFLLTQYNKTKDQKYLGAVEKTLQQIYRGGICDHIGGGFSRYSTDSKWLVPHFEKMLYDNAMLLWAYTEAFKITKNKIYKYVCTQIIEYVSRELTHEDGGFFCGQDADSGGIEGKYYVFTPAEIIQTLGEEKGQAFCAEYDITENGNFESRNIPNLLKNENYENTHISKVIDFKLLQQYRAGRTELRKDDKILTSWTSLMMVALVKAYAVFGNNEYLDMAQKAYLFIKSSLTDKNGRLNVRWRDGEAAGEGKLCDYAFLSFAALELYTVTLNTSFLETAVETAFSMIDRFFDHEKGGFYLYADDGEQLYTRPKEIYDGAIPSGNSVAALVIEKLAKLTADERFRSISERQFRYIAGCINAYPGGYGFALVALSEYFSTSMDLVCATCEDDLAPKVLAFLKERNVQRINVIIKTDGNSRELSKLAPFTDQYPVPHGGTYYYLCKNNECFPPVEDLNELEII